MTRTVADVPPLSLEDWTSDEDEQVSLPNTLKMKPVKRKQAEPEDDDVPLGTIEGDSPDKQRKRHPSYKGWSFTVHLDPDVGSQAQIREIAMILAMNSFVKFFSYRTYEGGAVFVVDFIVSKRSTSVPKFVPYTVWTPMRLSKKVILEIIGEGPGVWTYGSRSVKDENEEDRPQKKKKSKCPCPVVHSEDCCNTAPLVTPAEHAESELILEGLQKISES
jgi:hypothetical protein